MTKKFVKITSTENLWTTQNLGRVFMAEDAGDDWHIVEKGNPTVYIPKNSAEIVENLTDFLEQGYSQVCVFPSVILGNNTVEDFEKFFFDHGFRIKFLEEVTTLPDVKDGRVVEGTGGRHDIFFLIHNDDIEKFAIPRLGMQIRWWEDVLGNSHGNIYSQEILNKYPPLW